MSDIYLTCIGDGQDEDDDADKVAETVPGIGEVIWSYISHHLEFPGYCQVTEGIIVTETQFPR